MVAVFVLLVIIGTIAGPPPEDPEPKPVAASASPTSARPTPSTPAPAPPAPPSAAPSPSAPPSPPGRRAAPHPTAEQAQVYLARVRLIHPELAAKPDRDIRRARGICDRIINPPGGTLSLEDYTIYMLSGPRVQLDARQARQVIAAVKAWCR
jgi:hypothetical protein